MKNTFILILALLPIIGLGQANKLYREALRTENLEQRISLLNQVIDLEPKNLDAYFYRALAKNDLGDYEGAIVDYSKILLEEPGADTYFNRGNSRYNLKDYEGAKLDYAKAYELDRSFIDARYSLACTKYDLGEYTDAIADFNAILRIIPDLQIAYTLRASAYYALEDYKNALQSYSSAIMVQPDADAFYNRGVFYLDIRYFQKAKADLNTAMRLDKENPFIYFHRGASNLFLGDYEGAIEDFSSALTYDLMDFDSMLGLAMAYHKSNNKEKAKAFFDKAKSVVSDVTETDDYFELFNESYWYSKHFYYFKNSIDELLN